MLVRVVSHWFVAGLVIEDKKVVRAAPILKYMLGWSLQRVLRKCASEHWFYSFHEEGKK